MEISLSRSNRKYALLSIEKKPDKKITEEQFEEVRDILFKHHIDQEDYLKVTKIYDLGEDFIEDFFEEETDEQTECNC